MSKKFSHSKLSTFEQCKLKYKFKYIDKIISKERTIEAHLGTAVHEALEWLYKNVQQKKIPKIDELIIFYIEAWQKKFSDDILIIKEQMSAEDYFNKGIQFLLDYYNKHFPFDDNTLELEKKIMIKLENGNYEIHGFIDRLSYNLKTNEYEIHDYKTSGYLPNKEKIETDRQLGIYSIAVKELFGMEKEVCLIWHYLNFDKKICIKKTNEQLEKLKKETLELIKKIESTIEFSANKSVLCKWCEYLKICPAWN